MNSEWIRNPHGPELIHRIQTVINSRSSAKPIRHFGISPEIENIENSNSPLLTFRFIASSKFNDEADILPFNVQQNQLTTALKFSHPRGIILQSKEKGAIYPVVQFLYGRDDLETKEEYTIQGYVTKEGIYKELRELECDSFDSTHLYQNNSYIILGYKTTDVKYNQALLDSWKDWTGARYIYINFPDHLNLRKISLYQKQICDEVDLFSYIVIVKCDGVNNKDKETTLLDFVQRFRAQRTSNFISVYDQSNTNKEQFLANSNYFKKSPTNMEF